MNQNTFQSKLNLFKGLIVHDSYNNNDNNQNWQGLLILWNKYIFINIYFFNYNIINIINN